MGEKVIAPVERDSQWPWPYRGPFGDTPRYGIPKCGAWEPYCPFVALAQRAVFDEMHAMVAGFRDAARDGDPSTDTAARIIAYQRVMVATRELQEGMLMALQHEPINTNGCHNCWKFKGLTALHDDAGGGWLFLGRCEHPDSSSGLVDADHICQFWGETMPAEPVEKS